MFSLTQKQSETLAFIIGYDAKHGVAPSISEIAVGIGGTKARAHKLLCGLEERGAIRRIPNRARAIEIVRPALEHAAEDHLRAILADVDKLGCVLWDNPAVRAAMRFLGRGTG